MTAVIYARYSSDSQREASIEGQLRDCKAYAEKNGITVVGTYIDRAYSAKTDDRPDFQRMIKDSGKKIFDVVLVWKLDRFARNRYDAVNYKYQLEKNGVHLVSAMEPISQGPEGIMVESMLIGMAEYYSAELALKVVQKRHRNRYRDRGRYLIIWRMKNDCGEIGRRAEVQRMSDVRTGNETQKSFYTRKREITPYADDHVQKSTFLSAYVVLSGGGKLICTMDLMIILNQVNLTRKSKS